MYDLGREETWYGVPLGGLKRLLRMRLPGRMKWILRPVVDVALRYGLRIASVVTALGTLIMRYYNSQPRFISHFTLIAIAVIAKRTEDRYQTACGLVADLRRRLAEWRLHGRIDPFQLGKHDASDRLLTPEKRRALRGLTRHTTFSTEPSLHANQRAPWFSKPCGRDVFHSPPHVCRLAMSFALFLSIVPGTMAKEAQADQSSIRLSTVPQTHVDPRLVTLPMLDGKDIRFTRLSTARGLSQTKVSQIVQDNQGFLWFRTRYGLNRYDGYSFKIFVPEPGNPKSLSGVVVNALFKDRDGALWIGCDQFPDKLDP